MIKYILCMLFGALLLLGVSYSPDKELQTFQLDAGTESVQPCIQTDYFSLPTAHRNFNYDVGDGVLAVSSITRSLSSYKLLRFNDVTPALPLLGPLRNLYSCDKRSCFTLNINPARHSYRYFVYALKRILI